MSIPARCSASSAPTAPGKTTMMDVITGKTRPDSGTAWFGDSIDLLQLSEPEIVAAGIGRKFQKPTVFEQLTVFENLELALAGNRSFLKTLRARIHRRAAEDESTKCWTSSASRSSANRWEEFSRTGRSSGSKSACC